MTTRRNVETFFVAERFVHHIIYIPQDGVISSIEMSYMEWF